MLLVSGGAGGSYAVGPTSGGKVYAFNNIGATPKLVAPTNPQRTGINFYNPGPVNIWVAPQFVQSLNSVAAGSSNVALSPNAAALGGCYLVYANGGQISLIGECQGAWQAFAATGSANPLTVSDSNV